MTQLASSWMLILSVIPAALIISAPGAPCSEKCSCRDDTVSCDGRGYNVIPFDLPPGTKHLNLQQNNIKVLAANVFTSLPLLEVLNLSNNQLNNIEKGAFNGLHNLRNLALENNSISQIPDGTFLPLINMLELKLNGNQFEAISEYKINFIPSLRHLYLGHNSRKLIISPQSFAGLTNLTLLSLTANHIQDLNPGTFLGLHRLQTLDLSFNNLTLIKRDVFHDLPSLIYLRLDSTRTLSTIMDNAFEGMTLLRHLNLSACSLSEISKNTFNGLSALEELMISKNNIVAIRARSFCNVPHLQLLELDHNPLVHLERDSFRCLSVLKTLNLNACNLSRLSVGVFDWLRKVVMISLSNNRISNISHGTFEGKPKLSRLNLDFNSLEMMNVSLFSKVTSIHTLLLNDNHIKHLPEGIFENLKVPLFLELRNNPLVCDCRFGWLNRWLKVTEGGIDACECQEPQRLHGRHVYSIQSGEFHCRPFITNGTTTYHATAGDINYTMVCPVDSSPSPAIEWLTSTNEIVSADRKSEVFKFQPNGTLLITEITKSLAGHFSCKASNTLGDISAQVTLFVIAGDNGHSVVAVVVPIIIIAIIVAVSLGVAFLSRKGRGKGCCQRKSLRRYSINLHYNPLNADGETI